MADDEPPTLSEILVEVMRERDALRARLEQAQALLWDVNEMFGMDAVPWRDIRAFLTVDAQATVR